MRWVPFLVIAAAVVGIAAVGLFMLFASLAAAPHIVQAGQAATNDSPGTIILARRVISIPFGIEDTLSLHSDSRVQVAGHGICGAGGEAYKIRVEVTQAGVSAPAVGSTQSACLGDDLTHWQAAALLPGPHTFEPGAATACARAVIHYEREGAITHQWCKAVMLE